MLFLAMLYFVAVVLTSFAALVAGMFLQRGGFRQQFRQNPGKAALVVAIALGLVGALADPANYMGFGNTAASIFGDMLGAVIGIAVVCAVGYVLSPERVERLYGRTQRMLAGRSN